MDGQNVVPDVWEVLDKIRDFSGACADGQLAASQPLCCWSCACTAVTGCGAAAAAPCAAAALLWLQAVPDSWSALAVLSSPALAHWCPLQSACAAASGWAPPASR